MEQPNGMIALKSLNENVHFMKDNSIFHLSLQYYIPSKKKSELNLRRVLTHEFSQRMSFDLPLNL